MLLGLLLGELAPAAHLLDERVVARQPPQLPAAEQVRAAVADVREADLVAARRARAVSVVPMPERDESVCGELVDALVRLLARRARRYASGASAASSPGSNASAASRDATSPACAPPIPSATAKTGARAKKESSFALRCRPVSVRCALDDSEHWGLDGSG